MLTTCKKEEIVIVYSKIKTVGTSNTTSMATDVEGLIEELTATTHSEYGVCWDTIKDPTVYEQKSVLSGEAKIGSFTVHISGLKPGKTYHSRAFVIDNKKYIYGLDLSFTTAAANLPVVSTTSVTGITSKYAISGGNVTQEGDKPVIAKGVCFDTIAAPTIQKNKTMDGWGTGSYTSYLTNLKSSKTYYVRAYAVSEFGVSYGAQETFTTNTKLFYMHEEFSDNINEWWTGTETYGNANVTGGEYVIKYHNEDYQWWIYNDYPNFSTMANNKDYEINVRTQNLTYDTLAVNTDMIGGFLWDCGPSNFKYFGIKKNVPTDYPTSITYYYTIGSYNGSYTVWKNYTQFTGTAFNKLTIKKGSGYYYFFINDVQVYKQSYSNITYDGVGFYILDATLHADYLYIDQKGEKKSEMADFIKMIPASKGKRDFVRSY
jgi:hypothetical protein